MVGQIGMTLKEIGALIQQGMDTKSLNQYQLAEILGYDYSYVNKIVNGKIQASITLYEKIALELDLVFYIRVPIKKQ